MSPQNPWKTKRMDVFLCFLWNISSSATAAEASASTQPLWSRPNIPQDYSTELVHSSQYPTPPKQWHHPDRITRSHRAMAQIFSMMSKATYFPSQTPVKHQNCLVSNPIRKAPGADVFHQRKLLEMPPRCCFLVALETALETAPPSRAGAELRYRRMSWYQDGGRFFLRPQLVSRISLDGGHLKSSSTQRKVSRAKV